MFKYLLISIVIVPVLLGVLAAGNGRTFRGFQALVLGWGIFAALWLFVLHFLRHRWLG